MLKRPHGWLVVAWISLWIGTACPARSAAVYIEDSPAAMELADEAQTLADQGKVGEAAQRLQTIIDDFPDKLMPGEDGTYRDGLLWVREKLARDEVLLEAYRRRYTPQAERALAEAIDRSGDTDTTAEVRRVWDRYTLTQPGLEAALYLAGLRIEQADGDAARALLQQAQTHPDVDAHADQVDEFQAWAAHLINDGPQVAAALQALADRGNTERVAALRAIFEATQRPQPDEAAAELMLAAPPPLDRPLWEVTVSPREQRGTMLMQPNGRSRSTTQSEIHPVASAELLLFNDNDRVFALDRTAGRLKWNHRYEPEEVAENTRRFGGLGRVIADQRKVLLRGDSVYAVTGFAVPWHGRNRAQTIPPTQLVCLDVETGKPRWKITPGQLDETIARASFHGTPVACGDQVIVMARRNQASSFQDSYLLAVEAATGKLRWRRHLSSTAGPSNRNSLAAMSRMTLDGEIIYFCDNMGAAAAVDARTGTVLWIRILVEAGLDANGKQRAAAMPFSSEAVPTLCDAGLVLPLRIDDAHGMLLDPKTGQIKKRFASNSPMASALETLSLDGDLLVVGKRLTRLAGEDLSPAWTFTPQQPTQAASLRVTLRGKHAITASGGKQIDEIDLATGESTKNHTLPWNGRVLALGDAWVVSSGRRIGSYLDWQAAFAELRRRAEANPESPAPGLNLAMLAVNARQPDAVNEGIDRSLGALAVSNASTTTPRLGRAQVFSELLRLTERHDVLDPDIIERLFDRLAATTDTAGELVAYNIGRGEFLESQGRFAEAADFYQAVLLDPQLANERLTRGKVTRRSDIAARQRLVRLKQAHGQGFYERYDQRAQQELNAMQRDPSTNVSDLLALIRRYPLAKVAPEAIFAAAQQQAKTSMHAGAATQYRRAFQLTDDDLLRQRAAGALADYYQTHDRPEAARRWLQLVARDYPQLEPLRDGQPTPVAAWLQTLPDTAPVATHLPQLEMPLGHPIKLAGNLLSPMNSNGAPPRHDAVLIRLAQRNHELAYIDLPSASSRWNVPLPEDGVVLIHAGPDNLLLWSRSGSRLHGLDAANGQAIWPAIQANALLEDLGEGGLAETRRRNAGQIIDLFEQDFGPMPNNARLANAPRPNSPRHPQIVAGEAVVCVVDVQGRAVGIDRYTGQVLWQSVLAVDTVTQVKIADDVLLVGGIAAPGTESQGGRVLVVDLATGRMRFPPIEDGEQVAWLGFAPSGDILAITRQQATLLGRRDGGLRWRCEFPEQLGGNPIVRTSDSVAFVFDPRRAFSVDILTGSVVGETDKLNGRNTHLVAEDRIFSVTPKQSAAWGADLQPVWNDAIAHLDKQLLSQRLGREHVLVLARSEGPRRRQDLTLFALERDTGRLVAERPLGDLLGNGNPGTTQVKDNCLLFAGRGQIIILPGARPAAP